MLSNAFESYGRESEISFIPQTPDPLIILATFRVGRTHQLEWKF